MAQRRLRIVTRWMIVMALVLGGLLAVMSVPVAAVVDRLPIALDLEWAWLTDWERSGGARPYDVAEGIRYQRKDGFMSTEWEGKRRGPFREEQIRAYEERPSMREVTSDPRPRYARIEIVGERGEAAVYGVGWPFVAAFAVNTEGDSPSIRGTPMWEPRLWGETWFVPLQPRWFGLVVNAIFYGALVLAMLAALRWWRVRRRIKRGRCGACAYELGDGVTTCPECGLGRSVPSASA